MGVFGRRNEDNASTVAKAGSGANDVAYEKEAHCSERKARALAMQLPKNCTFHSSLVGGNCARVDMEAEVDVPAAAMFKLLANPQEHERIFEAIEGASSTLISEEGAKRRYTLDYQARWKFWRVTGVCENRLIMETDADEGTVTFRLREPGFLRTYEGTWQIIPKGSTGLHLHRDAMTAQQQRLTNTPGHAGPTLFQAPKPHQLLQEPTPATVSMSRTTSFLYGRPLGANMTALIAAIQSPLSEIHGHMSSFCSRILAPSSPSSPSRSPSSPHLLLSPDASPCLTSPGSYEPSDFSTLHSFSGSPLASMTAASPMLPNHPNHHAAHSHPAYHLAGGSAGHTPSLSRFAAAAALQPAGEILGGRVEQEGKEEGQAVGPAGSPTTSVVRVKGLLMSPKIAPPYPLGGLLKGQAISQVQDMLKGLMAAAQHAAAEEASSASTASKSAATAVVGSSSHKGLATPGSARPPSVDLHSRQGLGGGVGKGLRPGAGGEAAALAVTSHWISFSEDEGDDE